MWHNRYAWIVAAGLLASCGAVTPPARATDGWQLEDVAGKRHDPFESDETKALVLVFISTDCPIANAYQPEIRRLTNQYRPCGIEFFAVHSDRRLRAEAAAEHAAEFHIAAPVILDSDLSIARRVQATVTPEAVVVGRDGRILYQGRIDDLYADFGKKRPQASRRDLREALEAVAAGRPVAVPKTQAIGCFIES